MGILFAVLISITFGFAFNSVQSNTICAAAEHAFGFNHTVLGGVLTALTLVIIFGGIRRIAHVSSIIVPVMALGYVGLALVIVLLNITHLPEVISLIISHAFGWEQALGGGVGMALMQGIKRGLFSNEAGDGFGSECSSDGQRHSSCQTGVDTDAGSIYRYFIKLHLYGIYHSFQRCSFGRFLQWGATNPTGAHE